MKNKMNLPNKLTISRLIMIPFFIFFMIIDAFPSSSVEWSYFAHNISPWNKLIAIAIFIIAALTDVADGYLARKNNQVTNFGKFLDPIADKLLVFSALITMILVFTREAIMSSSDTYGEKFSIYLLVATIIVLFRELLVTSLRLLVVSSEEKIVIPANKLGKAKTGTQDAFIIFAIAFRVLMYFGILPIIIYYIICYLLLTLMVVFTIVSGISYLKAYSKYINTNK